MQLARCIVERLMGELQVQGPRRSKTRRMTIRGATGARPDDLVDGQFAASRPNELWIAVHLRRTIDEFATLEDIDWFNHRRLHGTPA
jgi:transposase InsO family protein